MTRPRMVVVAGPPGSGKSSHFPVDGGIIDGFNVDVRAAALNGGSFQDIPRAVRARAQRECETFIEEHLAAGKSFAVETTLRSGIAIEQARRAQRAGFETDMVFVTAGRADECITRVRLRGRAGGHAAPEAELRDIYARSMVNLALLFADLPVDLGGAENAFIRLLQPVLNTPRNAKPIDASTMMRAFLKVTHPDVKYGRRVGGLAPVDLQFAALTPRR